MKIKTAKASVVLTVILLCFCTSEVKAQFELILSGGVAVPRNFGRFWPIKNTGYNFGAELILPNDDSGLLFSVDLNVMGFTLDRKIRKQITHTKIETSYQNIINSSVVTVMANLTANLPLDGNVKIKVFAGIGLFRLDTKVDGSEANYNSFIENSQTKIGAKFGTGWTLPVNKKNSIVLTGQYLVGFRNGNYHHIIPIKIGWKYTL